MNAHLGGINMRKTNQKDQKGFTIIELLVVIVIIGILVALALPQLFAAQARGRDTDRKNDLKNVSQQLETYYNDTGSYPTGDYAAVGTALNTANLLSSDNFPQDPKNTAPHIYTYTAPEDGSSFTLSVTLENTNDSAATAGVYSVTSVNQ